MSRTDVERLKQLADWLQFQAGPSIEEWASYPADLRRIAEQLAQLQQERDSLKQQRDYWVAAAQEAQQLRDTNATMASHFEQEAIQLKQERTILTAKYNDAIVACDQLQQERDSLQAENERLKVGRNEELAECQSEYADFRKRTQKEYDDAMDEAIRQKNRADINLENHIAVRKKLEEERDRLAAVNRELETEITDWRHKVEEQHAEIEQLKSALAGLEVK